MIVVIDHADSFVHNLARYLRLSGAETMVIPYNQTSVAAVMGMQPEAIVFSPGPCSPAEAKLSVDLIQAASQTIPILGVCLGHQCIGEAFGGIITRAKEPLHGRSSRIRHDQTGLFEGLENPMEVGRYHSLIVTLPDPSSSPLVVTAQSEQGEIMALRHRYYPIYGVQFHPESILTEQGDRLIRNFTRSLNK